MLVDGSQLPTGQRAQRQRRGPAAAAGAGLVAAAATWLAAAAAAPRGTRPGRGKEGIASTSRLEQQVVSSRLWEPACQALQPPLPAAVPATFGSLQQYVAAFEPLMLEEAAEGIKAAFEESERAGRGADVEVQIVSSLSSEWHNVRLAAATPEALAALRQLQQDRDCSVVVLSLYIPADAAAAADEEQRATPPPGSRQQQQQQQQRGVLAARVTGLVRWWELEQGAVYVHVRPCCGKHPAEASSPCCKVLQQMQQWMDHPLGSWRLTPSGSIVTSVREFRTLERLRAVHPPLLDFILNPSKQKSDDNSTRASRSSASTEAAQQQPDPAAAAAAAAAAKELPSEVGSSAFRSYLTEHFDGPQIHAITCAAAHLVQQQQQQQRGSTPEQQDELDEDQQMHDQQEVDPTAAAAAAAAGQPYVPFTLIQGPPGTGKTHTVLGVLNAWHLTQFQRFFLSLDAAVRELAERGAKLDAEMTSDGFSGRLAPRPRILVCAPSNAAIDELLERILRGTFRDVNGRVYRPDVVRLGSEEALSEEARQVWVEQLCGRLLAHSVASYTAERQEQERQFQLCLRRMHNLTESLQVMQSMLVKERAAAAAPDGADAAAAAATHEQQVLGLVAQLVNEFEQLQKIKQALARLAVLEHLVAGPGSNEWGKRLAALQGSNEWGKRLAALQGAVFRAGGSKQALARLAVLEHLVAGPGSNEWGKRLAALQVDWGKRLAALQVRGVEGAAQDYLLFCKGAGALGGGAWKQRVGQAAGGAAGEGVNAALGFKSAVLSSASMQLRKEPCGQLCAGLAVFGKRAASGMGEAEERKQGHNRRQAGCAGAPGGGPGSVEWGKRLAALQAAQQQKQQQQHAAHQPGQPPHFNQAEFWRAAFRAAPREVQSDLEMSFVEKAEMVFTTLSSSARDVFSRLVTPFELVLVDEAAQAAEIAALQPLVYGAKAVVMVGDPQQLPATLFSQAAKQLALERSLFERLAEAGCPVNVLTVQYRMHPAIRTFPSAYFYHSQLIDAPSVLQRPRPWFDAAAAAAAAAAAGVTTSPAAAPSSSSSVLLPYVVYDVSRGRERFAARGGKSPENELEARMAVALYGEVRRVRAAALAAAAASVAREPPQLRLDVGVITPYRGQRTLLRRLFEQRFGKAVLQEVKIETVDSFQGKQLDIVILSCVRAPKGGTAGPVAAAAAEWPESTGSTTADRPAQQAVQKALQRAEQAASADAAASEDQQQQQEPISLQLVRKGGVGFLSDTRRMNVAITRARQALYVLGHCDTLVSNPAWAALIGDAGARGCLVWDAQPDDVADQQRRAALAGKLHKARQLQEAMMPSWQQQQAADAAAAAAAVSDEDGGVREGGAADRMLVDASTAAATNPSDQQQQQQQQGRTGTPPLGAAAAAAGTADDGSAKDWLQAMRESQAAELKRKSEGQQQQQQPKNKRQRLLAEEQREGSDAGGSAPGTPQLPGTPQHTTAAAAGEGAAAAAGQQSPVQQQQATEQQMQQLQLNQQQQQQQVAEDEVWWGAPGDGFDTYRGMTPKQGAVLWLLAPLVQQSMLRILLAMSPQEVAGALQRMSPADVAWVLPALQQQQQQQGAAAAGFVPGQQQQLQQGGQLALPGHGPLPPGGAIPGAITGPGQQQQQQQHLLGPPPQQGGYAPAAPPAAAAGAGFAGPPQQLLMQQQQQQQPGVPGMPQQGVLLQPPGIQMMVLQAQHAAAAAAAGLGGPPMQQFVMGPDGTVLQQQQQQQQQPMFCAAQGQQLQQQDPGQQQQQQGGQQGWKGKQQKHQGGQSPVGGRGQQQQHGGRGGGRGGRGGGRQQQQQGKGGGRGGRGGDGQQQQGRGGGRGGGRGQQQQQHRQGGGGGRGRGRVMTADNK
uniref:Uncharacterized protein n=1 Tax=Tetradesmus obliquus TaxID=3088 RepID=A0A383W880_TETOB